MKLFSLSSFLLRSTDNDLESRARWYVRTRWFFLLAIAFPAVLSNLATEGYTAQVKRDSILAVVALSSNLIFLILSRLKRKQSFYRTLCKVMIAVDTLTITTIIYTKGGVESRSPILYTIPILMASAIFGKKGVYWTAAISIVVYDSLILLDWGNVIQTINAVNPDLRFRTPYMLNTIAFFSSVLLIIATLADFIVRLLEEKEHEMREAVDALEQAQAIASLGSWRWDIKSDRITWSKQLYKLFGLESSGFIASLSSYIKFVHPDDIDLVQETVAKAIKDLEPFSFEHRFLKDGKVIWIHAEGQVVSEDGEAKYIYGTAQDVTEQVHAKTRLDRQRHELEKLNSLMVGRELKMIELKEKVAILEKELSK